MSDEYTRGYDDGASFYNRNDEIEDLTAENAKLRKALEKIELCARLGLNDGTKKDFMLYEIMATAEEALKETKE